MLIELLTECILNWVLELVILLLFQMNELLMIILLEIFLNEQLLDMKNLLMEVLCLTLKLIQENLDNFVDKNIMI